MNQCVQQRVQLSKGDVSNLKWKAVQYCVDEYNKLMTSMSNVSLCCSVNSQTWVTNKNCKDVILKPLDSTPEFTELWCDYRKLCGEADWPHVTPDSFRYNDDRWQEQQRLTHWGSVQKIVDKNNNVGLRFSQKDHCLYTMIICVASNADT